MNTGGNGSGIGSFISKSGSARMQTEASGAPILAARDVVKSYGEGTVLKGISLDIAEGDLVSIIGPSGCGKSTLLRCLNFLEIPDSGSITVDGVAISSQKRIRTVGPRRRQPRANVARSGRHGVPELQPVPASHGARQRHARADGGEGRTAQDRAGPRRRAAAQGPSGRIRRPLSRTALRRPAAARRHRPRAGHGAEGDAVRRTDLGARPRPWWTKSSR